MINEFCFFPPTYYPTLLTGPLTLIVGGDMVQATHWKEKQEAREEQNKR